MNNAYLYINAGKSAKYAPVELVERNNSAEALGLYTIDQKDDQFIVSVLPRENTNDVKFEIQFWHTGTEKSFFETTNQLLIICIFIVVIMTVCVVIALCINLFCKKNDAEVSITRLDRPKKVSIRSAPRKVNKVKSVDMSHST